MLHCFSTPLPKIDTIMLQHPHMVVAGLYDGSVIVAASPHGGGRECYCCNIPTWWWPGVLLLQHPTWWWLACMTGVLLLQHPHMVVAGLYDGSVAVYNLQSKASRPSHVSDAQNG